MINVWDDVDAFLENPIRERRYPLNHSINKKDDVSLPPPTPNDVPAESAPLLQVAKGSSNSLYKESDDVLRAVFSSILDFMLDMAQTESKNVALSEFRQMLINLRLVPAEFFNNETSPIRDTMRLLIGNVLTSVMDKFPGAMRPGMAYNVGRLELPYHFMRFTKDFREICELGKGGFGSVVKVLSRVDRCYYAVKKIKFRIHSDLSHTASNEVLLLARLSHPNIVRYYNAWIEVENMPSSSTNSSPVLGDVGKVVEVREDESTNDDPPLPLFGETGDVSSSSYNPSFGASSDGDMKRNFVGKFFQRGESSDSGSGCGLGLSKTTKVKSELSSRSCPSHNDSDPTNSEDIDSINTNGVIVPYGRNGSDNRMISIRPRLPRHSLYIQMELCDTTLESFLLHRNRNYANNEEYAIFHKKQCRQLAVDLLTALSYLREKNVIHRDIKPSNVFLNYRSNEWTLLLGDFGLACLESSEMQFESHSPCIEHSQGVGTQCYAAPEQLHSRSYDASVDVYSVGLVIFELHSVFRTSMEKQVALKQMRQTGRFPSEFSDIFPKMGKVLSGAVCQDASMRPTPAAMLASLSRHKDVSDESKFIIDDLRHQIKRLEDMLKSADKKKESFETLIETQKMTIYRLQDTIKTQSRTIQHQNSVIQKMKNDKASEKDE